MRLAKTRDAEAFALRGGMLVRSWVPDRRVRDLDLVCSLPYQPRAVTARLGQILATPLDDGVTFDEKFRVDRLPTGPHPGLSVFALGEASGKIARLTLDLTFGLEIWPAAAPCEIAMARGTVRIWTLPHEMVVGTKLGVIAELGPRAWRPKDLADCWLLLRRFRTSSFGRLGEAIERCFTRKALERDLLAASWWREPDTASRWARYAARTPSLPFDLDAVVGELRENLSPLVRS